jgi:GNAT superfamily N-acetyltransferase
VAAPDLAELDGLFRPGLRDYKAKVFRQRLQDGYLCYGAWIDNRLVALDWVATNSDYESTSRVQLTLSAGSCYGLDLNEHPDYKDQGIGLALLSYALDDCRKRGFERQYTIVHGINKTMLLTSTQLFGFKPIGKIWTRKVLGGHRASWEIDGRSGGGAQLTL